MRFCNDCGTVLNLFGNRETELCSACIQHKKEAKIVQVPVKVDKIPDTSILGAATLSFHKGKIILRSKEGWELWSCNQDNTTELKTILARATRIYEIRLRRQKN
ncbi:MAG: hypothetical protein ACI8ZB_002372 [Desulforhopalus sp.]|jgi:hypothetical protein